MATLSEGTLSELRAKAAELRKLADKLDAAVNAVYELRGSTANGAPSIVPSAASKLADLTDLSGVEAICNVLVDANKPLKKADILRLMRVRGKAIGAGTLDAYLSREKRLFKSHGGGHWGLVDKVYS